MKLRPEMREALKRFMEQALDSALDGVEAREDVHGQRQLQIDFTASNDLVDLRVELLTAAFWSPKS